MKMTLTMEPNVAAGLADSLKELRKLALKRKPPGRVQITLNLEDINVDITSWGDIHGHQA